jgi:HSP20 family protein
MNAVRHLDSPRSFGALQAQMNRVFDQAFRNHGRPDDSSVAAWAPAVDIYEADIPDLGEKDLDVQVENNMLTIRGERKFEQQGKEESYLRVERAYGSFMRSFALPNTVSTEDIRADYKNGVLTVTLPKRAESKPKQVKISIGGNGGNNRRRGPPRLRPASRRNAPSVRLAPSRIVTILEYRGPGSKRTGPCPLISSSIVHRGN